MRVALLFRPESSNDKIQRELWKQGIERIGWEYNTSTDPGFSDIAVVWGLPPRNKVILRNFRKADKPVIVVDYPYWNRPGKEFNLGAAYKVSLNGLHPTEFVNIATMSPARYIESGGPSIAPWKKSGQYILIAGMGIKGEELYNYRPCEWDQRAVDTIRRHSKETIIYRKKPSNKSRRIVTGAVPDTGIVPLEHLIANAMAVVTHHGNAAIEAIIAGIPGFVNDGVATLLGNNDLSKIMKPVYSDQREQFLHNLAWWQWTGQEIADGMPLLSLKQRRLI